MWVIGLIWDVGIGKLPSSQERSSLPLLSTLSTTLHAMLSIDIDGQSMNWGKEKRKGKGSKGRKRTRMWMLSTR